MVASPQVATLAPNAEIAAAMRECVLGPSPLPPDLQLALERLFRLFSDYVAADNARQRRSVHNQIHDLFSQLGVISDSPLVRQAVEMFDQIRREPDTPKLQHAVCCR